MSLYRKPRVGERVVFPSGSAGTITRVGDDIAHFLPDGRTEARYESCFIWRFNDGLNTEVVIHESGVGTPCTTR